MKKVITYGTFDLLHAGHINILRRARELGDYLIVVLSTDEFNAVKNKKAYYSYEDRKLILEAIRYVDEVIPEYNWEQKIDDVVRNKVDVFVMGDDWKGKFDFLKEYCEVIYLPRTEGISTTKIKTDLHEEDLAKKAGKGAGREGKNGEELA
ncbi:MAG: glycerol-3-phosphate cytidylyltransferase [Lachnospiraceae bacterium]|nr:glycerol-3-phosphate cytidylyltransferase [Lachnospiraceae bacterium]